MEIFTEAFVINHVVISSVYEVLTKLTNGSVYFKIFLTREGARLKNFEKSKFRKDLLRGNRYCYCLSKNFLGLFTINTWYLVVSKSMFSLVNFCLDIGTIPNEMVCVFEKSTYEFLKGKFFLEAERLKKQQYK